MPQSNSVQPFDWLNSVARAHTHTHAYVLSALHWTFCLGLLLSLFPQMGEHLVKFTKILQMQNFGQHISKVLHMQNFGQVHQNPANAELWSAHNQSYASAELRSLMRDTVFKGHRQTKTCSTCINKVRV